MHSLSEHHILLFLVQLLLLLGLARGLGELFQRFQQPPMTAEILVGVLLGPTILGRFFPALHAALFPADPAQHHMLETVAWLGVFFLLLESGLEIDFSSAWRQKGDALKIAVAGVMVPLVIIFVGCLGLPDKYLVHPELSFKFLFALFMAASMSITAMPTVSRTLYDLNLAKTDLGFLIMSALSVNDILGWAIVSLILVLFTSGQLIVGQILALLAATLIFVVICLTAGRAVMHMAISRIREWQMPEPRTSLTFIFLAGLLCAAVTQAIGVHALFGFLIAGIMAGSSKALSERTRQVISQMVFAIFVPLFFASIGLRIDFIQHFDLMLIVFVAALGIAGKFWGAWLGARFTDLSPMDRLTAAIAHTPGGMMEIVLGLLALENHLISETVFVSLVCGGLFSSIIVGPWLGHSVNARKEISLLEFFPRRAVIPELSARTREEAIEELCELATLQAQLPDSKHLKTSVLKREDTMGTAIEEGTALPHARMAAVQRPLIVFGRSLKGIEWNSPDGKSSQFIFLILTNDKDAEAQVQILRGIARAVNDPRVRESLLHAGEQSDIYQVFRTAMTATQIKRR